MPDDEPPGSSPPTLQISAAAKLSPATEKSERIELTREQLGRGYSPSQVIAWLERQTPDKPWKVGRSTARNYVNLALESLDSDVKQPKDRKQARTRAMLTMVFQRAFELATDDQNKARAAGLLTAAIAACDKIARIDGAYAFDASSLLPPSINPATAEEAIRIVAHAQATIDLAQRRGAIIAARSSPPPVIDASSTEVHDDEIPEPDSDDAN